jgi:hypothetical protein
MSDSPYATEAAVLEADLTSMRDLFFYHTSRHKCRTGECEVLSLARDIVSEWLERKKASPSPQRSVVFTPWPPGF